MKQLNHSVTAVIFRYAVPALLVLVSLALLASPYAWLAPLPGIAVIFLLWIVKRDLLAWLFYGIVILIPFGAYRGLRGELSFLRLHWLFAAVLAFFVVIQILMKKRLPEEVRSPKFWGLLALFYIVNIFAMLGSKVPQTSASFMILLATGYLLIALGMILVDRKGFGKTIPKVVVGSVFAGSILAVLGAVFKLGWFVSATSGRVLGGAPDPNNMSLMIIFSLPFAVYFMLTSGRVWTRLFLLLVVAVDVAAVISTFSRGGALILLLSVLLMFWEFRHMISPRSLGLLFGVAGLVVTALLLVTPESYQERIRSIKAADDFAMRRRMSYLVVARELVADRPLFGNGPDAYAPLYARTDIGRSFRRSKESGARDAHNTYIEVLTGSGIIGLAFFLAVLLYAFKSFNHAQRLFVRAGRSRQALLVRAYRTAYLTLLVYLMIFSDVYHKYLLLSLAMSQVALRQAVATSLEREVDYGIG